MIYASNMSAVAQVLGGCPMFLSCLGFPKLPILGEGIPFDVFCRGAHRQMEVRSQCCREDVSCRVLRCFILALR